MLARLRTGVVSLGFVLVAACGAHRAPEAARPEAPAPLAIAPPAIYAADQRAVPGGGIEEICRIDPGACPRLDMDRAEPERGLAFTLAQKDTRRADGPQIQLTGPLAAAPAVRRIRRYGYSAEEDEAGGGATLTPSPPSPIAVKPARAARAEQFDVEAKVRIEVVDIAAARRKVAALLESFEGQTLNEAIEDGTEQRGASLSLRVPSARVRDFVARLGEVGKVRSSTLETREVSRALGDAALVQHNLEQAIVRYEELMKQAANVSEATAIEAELQRVRTELDRVRGDLEWAKDRVARSTVYVTLSLAPAANEVEPVAKLYPGLRAVLLVDVPPSTSDVVTTTYGGAGLSLQWTRAFDLDLDLLNDLTRSNGSSVDFYALTLGTALYSDYFGGGRRRVLNPYLGFRAGYAHAPHQSLFPVGTVLGAELMKSETLALSLEARAYALIGRKAGPDFALEPALGLNVAY